MSDNFVTFTMKTAEGGEEEITLKPIYKAARGISKHFGGYMPAIDAVGKLDPSAIEVVIAFGADIPPSVQKSVKLPERIYETGVAKVAAPCVEFLTILMNGGQRPGEEEEATSTEGEA